MENVKVKSQAVLDCEKKFEAFRASVIADEAKLRNAEWVERWSSLGRRAQLDRKFQYSWAAPAAPEKLVEAPPAKKKSFTEKLFSLFNR